MSNIMKFTSSYTGSFAATEAPEWIQRMSDYYAKTGTVRRADAARLFQTTDKIQLCAGMPGGRNADEQNDA